jgi:hypothetical protein
MPADPELVKASNNLMNAVVKVILPGFGIILVFVIVWALLTGWFKRIFTKLEQKIFQRKDKTGKCPHCGGALLNTNGKFGPFIGCNNYPRCKYSVNKKD